MATLDEIFASMPEEAAEGVHDLLIIDPEARTIDVPDTEKIFGVENDGRAETKYFQAPRYVGHGIDLAACFLRVNFQNANGDRDGYLVNDLAISGDSVLFSWELSKKVTQYKGAVQFVICANLPGSTKVADWHTTLAQGAVLEGLEPDAAAVEAASSDIIAQLLQLVTSQTAAVEAAGAAQVANVQTEGATQVNAVKAAAAQAEADALAEIEAKKQNTLAEIPEDYTAMGNQVDKLTRSTAGAIICEAEGQTIQVHDASNNYLQGLRIFGRSTQDGTPTPEAPVEIVSTPAPVVRVCGKNLFENVRTTTTQGGLDFTVNADGSVEINGTATEDVFFYMSDNTLLAPGTYHLSGTPAGGSTETYYMYMYPDYHSDQDGRGYTFTVKKTTAFSLRIFVAKGTVCSGVVFHPQIEAGTTATDYCPGTTQLLPITTPANLPGIPVSSGGNYTDANGQQWICDEVDLGRGVYVQRVGIKELPGAGNWTVANSEFALHISEPSTDNGDNPQCLCAHYPAKSRFDVFNHKESPGYMGIAARENYIRVVDNVNFNGDVAAFTAWLTEQESAGDPVKLLYILANSVERALPEEELAAWRNLRSNKPTTTILNDAGAHMAVEYVADTKLYIDRKLAEVLAANNT